MRRATHARSCRPALPANVRFAMGAYDRRPATSADEL
jgi:hypothetical protein